MRLSYLTPGRSWVDVDGHYRRSTRSTARFRIASEEMKHGNLEISSHRFFRQPENLHTWLNEKGKEGWELVHVEQPDYWFKRQEGMMESRAA
jgi:hypothetical protein